MIKAKRKQAVQKGLYSAFMLAVTLIWAIPLFIIFCNALKSEKEIAVNPNGFPSEFVWSNLSEAFIRGEYGISFVNSFIIMTVSTVLIILTCASIAYVIARNSKKRWSNTLYLLFLMGMMVPGGLLMTANYKLLNTLHIINTPFAGIFLNIAAFSPLIIFLYTGYINTVPRELDESAYMDGCSTLRLFWKIIFPLLK